MFIYSLWWFRWSPNTMRPNHTIMKKFHIDHYFELEVLILLLSIPEDKQLQLIVFLLLILLLDKKRKEKDT